ncbi:hypothetical protein AKJ43_02040 [candidate division MSBL1 archaeon SCGC-AAA261D19]|uniref:Uncharacterized protein n=1 Tax=candidate division MSBL1 archaeon SCGC-AAA261D19 TaxID=1698273 RepID=A0A133V753_9EURY|nr:hypothetical protein AKJ43_02040 [candidate division MSBL1 archaeon SCGC-AAA261D19]
MSLPKLPEGWEILYTAYLYRDKVKGETRLNKTLSEFQKEGLPIEEKFEIRDYGPYSKEVHEKARKLQKKGLLEIEEEELSPPYDKRTNYMTTARGDIKVEKEIFPLLQNYPIPDAFLKNALKIVRKFKKMNNKQIVNKVHDDLFIDNQNKYYEEMVRTNRSLSEYLEGYDKAFEKFYFCDALVQALGSIELCYNATNNIIPQFSKINGEVLLTPKMAGNNHILCISQNLIELIRTKLKNHIKNHSNEENEECVELANDFQLLLLKAEQNSKIYDIHVPTLEA